MTQNDAITGVILAGGQGRRMGGEDKGLLPFSGLPLVEHVLRALTPQLSHILINANRNPSRYAEYAPVIADTVADFAGPLAGMLAAMEQVETAYILTVPCDGPYLPADLVQRLWTALQSRQASIAVAHDGQRLQPVYALIDTRLQESLRQYLLSGERKIDRWYQQHDMISVDFSDNPETFVNINHPEELETGSHRHQESPA